jgi:hypothetical protein
MRARKRPFGDRRIWENGPRDRRYLLALSVVCKLGSIGYRREGLPGLYDPRRLG